MFTVTQDTIFDSSNRLREARDDFDRVKTTLEWREFYHQRYEALKGTYAVGADTQVMAFYADTDRLKLEANYGRKLLKSPRATHGHPERELYQLHNGDIFEYGMSVCHHTTDVEYALDRLRRRTIGGYSFSSRLADAIRTLQDKQGDKTPIGAVFGGTPFSRHNCRYAHSGENNLWPSEHAAELQRVLKKNKSLNSHAEDEIDLVIGLLKVPDAIRSFPAEFDPHLAEVLKELEEKCALGGGA